MRLNMFHFARTCSRWATQANCYTWIWNGENMLDFLRFNNHIYRELTYQKSTQHNLPVHFVEVCRAGKVQKAPRSDWKNVDEVESEFSTEPIQYCCRQNSTQRWHESVYRSWKVNSLELSLSCSSELSYQTKKPARCSISRDRFPL